MAAPQNEPDVQKDLQDLAADLGGGQVEQPSGPEAR